MKNKCNETISREKVLIRAEFFSRENVIRAEVESTEGEMSISVQPSQDLLVVLGILNGHLLLITNSKISTQLTSLMR